jgi:hypothetical protein
MSENRDFEQQLHGLASDAARQSRLGSADDIRRRAGRRRALQVSATAAATVLVVAGAWAVAAPGGDDAGTGPAGPSTSTPTTPEEGTGTGTISTTEPSNPGDATTSTGPELPPQEPGPTGGPDPSAPPADQPPPGGWVITLPDDPAIVLPHWLETGGFEEDGAWAELPDGVDTWLLTPCDATERSGYPSDSARSAHLVIGQPGVESFHGEQIAVYPSDVEAMQAVGELRQALVDCQAERTVRDGEDELSRTYTDSYWGWADARDVTAAGVLEPDEAFQAWNWNRTYLWDGSPQYALGGGFYTVVRVGNAVLLTVRDGETDWGAPGAAEDVPVAEAKTARGVVPALCERYAGAGGC